MPFAQRYALLLPEALANSRLRNGGSRPSTPDGKQGRLALPLTASGFVDWFALSEPQVGIVG